MAVYEYDFYNNFFTMGDEDTMKSIVHLSPIPTSGEMQFGSLKNSAENPGTYIIRKGTKLADLLFTENLQFVVSDRFKSLFQGMNGIEFTPVHILSKDLISIDESYYNIAISGRCGQIQNELSKEVPSTRMAGGPIFMKRVGLFFDPTSWDMSDFFNPEGTLYVFITQKIKDIIISKKLTNIKIRPISEVENFTWK